MHNIIFPLKDTILYSKYPEINTGLDEILEITKEVSSSNYFFKGTWNSSSYYQRYDYVDISGSTSDYYFAVAENINEIPSQSAYWVSYSPTASNENSRILIKFNTASFESTPYQSASVAYLNLFTSIAREIPTEYTLEARPISGSWEMGVGNFTTKLNTGGATWRRKSSTESWISNGGDWQGTVQTQTFNFVPTDIRMDVTDIFNEWSSSTYPNDGFIIKRTDAQEQNTVKYGSLSFYSLDTHTVYVPTLEIAYDDHIYDTSSFLIWNTNRYETSTTYSLNIESSSLDFATTSSDWLNIQSASLTSSQTFTIDTELNYTYGGNIFLIASESQSATMTGTVINYTGSSGNTIANITTTTGTGSYSLWYVDVPIGQATEYHDVTMSVGPDLAYTIGQSIIITGSAAVSMSGIVVNYDSSGSMTASISSAVGTGSILNGYVNLASGEEIGHTVTGSVSGSLLSGSVSIEMKRRNPEYMYNTQVRFRITAKPSYIAKTFYEELRIGTIYYLPEDSYYSIRDAYSNRIMVPFSDYTKISLDETGHYFDVPLSGFMPERFYNIIFKSTMSGSVQYFDPNSQFKVVK